MLEFPRDQIWQFVATVLTLVAIAVSVFLYLLQKRYKALAYEVVSNTSLLSVKEEIRRRVQILFDGKPVDEASMVVIRVLNSGNVPILPSDYMSPIRLEFGDKARILSAEVMATNPKDIEVSVEAKTGAVFLNPILLNSGDSITVKTLLADSKPKVEVGGRIVGVKRIQFLRENVILPIMLVLSGAALALLGLILMAAGQLFPFGVILIFLGYGLATLGGSERFRRILNRNLVSGTEMNEE